MIFGWSKDDTLKVTVDTRFLLDNAPDGHKYLESQQARFRTDCKEDVFLSPSVRVFERVGRLVSIKSRKRTTGVALFKMSFTSYYTRANARAFSSTSKSPD